MPKRKINEALGKEANKPQKRTKKSPVAPVPTTPIEPVPIINNHKKFRVEGMPWVGAHVSAAGGVQNAVTNSTKIHANAAALFVRCQRKWTAPPLSEDQKKQFKQLCVDHEFDPRKHFIPHGSYLINLGNADEG